MSTYFISGYDNLSAEEFNEHYAHRIRKSNADEPTCRYVLGDETPADRYAQEFLRKIGVSPERITIYYKHDPPLNPYRYQTVEIASDLDRRRAMVNVSTHDITYLPTGDNCCHHDMTACIAVKQCLQLRRKKLLDAKKPRPKRPLVSIYVPKSN